MHKQRCARQRPADVETYHGTSLYWRLYEFAVLTRTRSRQQVLSQVAQAIEQIKSRRTQRNVASATFLLAGLVLEKEIINTLLREEIVKGSVTYQEIVREATKKGIQPGIQQGIEQGIEQVAMNMLARGLSIAEVSDITGLSVRELSKLQKAKTKQTKN